MRVVNTFLGACLLVLGASGSTFAQVYSNGLDTVGFSGVTGPSNLLSSGWTFPYVFDAGLSHNWWEQAPRHSGHPAAWEGSGFLAAGISVPPFGTQAYVQWAILPPLSGQAAGQVLTGYIRGFTGTPGPGSVEVRYSPTGGTGTGGTTSSVGDFTQILDTNSNGSMLAWEQFQAAVPGNGRIAFRWHGTISGGFSGTSLNFFLDDLVLVNDPNAPRMPQPGETVHWTPRMNPIRINTLQTVPRGGTLVIDAGVQIFFDSIALGEPEGGITAMGGVIRLEGTSAAPVLLRRGVNTSKVPGISVGAVGSFDSQGYYTGNAGTSGSLMAEYVDSDVSIVAGKSATLMVRNCFVHRDAEIDWFSMTDSQFQVPRVQTHFATALVQDCAFHNAIAQFGDSLFRIFGCDFDNSRLNVIRFPIAQTAVIEGNTFHDSPVVAPLELDGYDVHISSSNTFVNNFAAVSLRGAGLTPDSVVPATGNVENRVLFTGSSNAMDIVGPMTLPPMSMPYRLWAGMVEGQQFDSRVSCLAGTTIEMDPDTYLSFQGVARFEVLGTPEAPVRFIQSVPGQPWITFQTISNPPLIVRNGIFDGGIYGVGGGDTRFTVHDCVFSNNTEGVRSGDYGAAIISKSRFVNNGIGIHSIWGGGQGTFAEGVFWEYGAANASAFEGNVQGTAVMQPYANTSWMRNAWWDSPTGPTSPSNPSGTGQSASFGVDVLPYRTVAVNFNDHPPVVRVKQVAYQRKLRLGTKIFLHWDARDDGSIVSQRLERLPVYGFRDPITVNVNIPTAARSVELTLIPDGYATQVYRIVSVDNTGQEGFDDYHISIAEDHPPQVNFLTDLSGGYRVGEEFSVRTSMAPTEVQLHIDDQLNDMQPRGTLGLEAIFNTVPAVSTDLARFAANFGNEPHYSPYFTIRPQIGFGDEAPVIAMTSPVAGESYSGGSVVPITWTASDDRGIRSFDLQASYDGGESWHVFAAELAGTAVGYNWQLPASTGIADVRIRVIARDSQFQVTSDGTNRVISILAGDWSGVCAADFNSDGTVDFFDYLDFVESFATGAVHADFNGDRVIDFFDYLDFVNAFSVGC